MRPWRGNVWARATLFDEERRLLIVKPVYRDGWLIPGGSVEQDESPREACEREVREELGFDVRIGRLLCVDYTARDGDKPDALQFVFHGGVLVGAQIAALVLPEGELSEFRFLPPDEALPLLTPKLRARVPHCLCALDEHATYYLENGQRVD